MASELGEPVRAELHGFEPAALAEVEQELDIIGQQLGLGGPPVTVHEIHARLLKCVVSDHRRAIATRVDEPRMRTGNRDAIRFLGKELRVLDAIVAAPWFTATQPARLPRLTDYLSVRYAERATTGSELAPRVYDEKFHILEAPTLFLTDLAYYRRRCLVRRIPVAVVYLDIDDFKAFNTKYGETRVDRDVLAPFMELLEAHTFGHGHAYRFGGDEYVLLLPNMTPQWTAQFMDRLQGGLRTMALPGIPTPPSISAGVCPVGPTCFLTDREVQERANRAKNHAKAQGKDCVSAYVGELYRDEDLSS